MAVRPILVWPAPALRVVCTPVDRIDAEIAALVADMFDTMYAAPGRGLAAPQIGVTRRLFVMDGGWKDGASRPLAMVNPVLDWVSEARAIGPEACLSIPGVTAQVARAQSVRMQWTDLDGHRQVETLSGFEAVCAQHELDHLNGLVTLDHLPEAERTTAEATLAVIT